jgi:autotransporter-associated beta strand protein
VGAGETSDRKIRLNTTTGSTQIHADGSGPLILTNVANDMAAGAKTLFLRGTNTAGNMISSVLADNGGTTLGVTVDGGASWILTAANTYTGVNTASAGALGIGNDAALGTGGLTNNNGNVFAYGADRTLTNILTLSNNATNGWQGDYSLTFSNPTILAAAGNNVTTTNNIVAGKTLTLNGVTANALTANRAWAIDGAGETVINGNFTTSTAFGVRFDVNGGGTLNLGTNGATSSFNQSIAAVDVDRGTLKFSANNAIPTTTATNGGIIISPEIAVNDTATVDLNGTTQTINTLTATTDGAVVIDNTSGTAATFRFGANDTAVNINPATTGARTITDSGAGVLNLVKLGTTTTTFNSGMTLTYQGTTAAEAGTFTINSDLAGSTGLIASGASTLTLNGALTTASGNISLSATGNSTLALTGGISNPNLINSITVGAGSTLNLLDGAGSLISNLTSLNLGNSGAGTATLNLNIGDSATDTLTLLTMGTLNLGNTITFNMTDVGLSPLTTYTLLNLTDGGLSAFGLGNVIQGATPGGFSGFTWNVTDNLVQITTGTLITGQSFWRGATNNTWNGNVNNWSTDKAGSISAVSAPGQGTDVVFAYDGVGAGPLTTTLGQNFKVNSLTFEAGTTTPTAVTIAPGAVATNRLEVAPQVATDGVTMTATGPAAVTVSAPFRLGANQDWQVDGAAQTLTLSGALLAAADVTKSGPGRVVLGAAADASFNTGLTADFTVNAGNLELTNAGALGTVANANLATVTVNSGGFYYNNAASGTVANPLTLAGGTLSAGGAAQTYSGTLAVSSASTINMADSNGPVANTARNITLSGVVSGNGSLTIDSNNGTASVTNLIQQNGTLTMNNAGNTWTGDLIFNRGSVTLAAAASPSFTGNNVTINSFGRLSIQGVNAQTLTRTGTLGYGAGAIGELGVDNTSGTLGTNFVVQQNGAVSLGSAGTGASVRVFLADVASALNIGGAVTLGGNSSISVAGGDADSFLTISGIIGDGGSGYGLAINDDAQGWGQATNTIVRLTGANTFSGNVSLDAGVLEFDTVSNVSGAASSLGQGTAITTTNAATLRFVGSSAQSTNRPITTAGGGLTLSANGATAADTITYAGAINVGPTADGTQITLTGAAGRVGIVSGGITQTGDTADMQVTGGTWTHQTGTSRVGDDLTVTGATTIFNLDSGLFQVRDDLTVTAGANLNLNGTGVLSFNTATLSGDASLRANGGGAITLGANNPIVTTEFDGFRLGTDAAGVGTLNMGTFNQNANEFLLGNRNIDRSGVVNGTGVLTVTGNFDIYGGTINANLASTGTGTLDKLSLNTVTLTGDNSGLAATGATVVTEGTLVLDYTNNTATKVRAASALDMRGATLNLVGNAGAAVAQTVGSFTLGSGGSSILNITKAGQDVVLNLGVITRAANSQDGTIRFNLPTDAPSATNGYTTGSLNTIGAGTDAILGGWATVTDSTGTYFARNLTNVAGGNIGIASTTSQNVVGSWVNGQNISDSGSTFSGTVSGSNLNSLRFNNSGGSELTVAQGGVLSLASGGILVTSNAGGTPSILGGTLASSYGTGTPEIIVNQDSAATLEIGSDIRAGHIFFKTGTGTVLLSGQNTYTGLTEIQNGTLQVSGGNAIGDNSLVTLGAGRDSTLQLLADETIGRLNGGSRNQDQELGTVAIGTHTLTVNQSATQTYAGRITGTGSLVMNSGNTGNLNLSNISAGFTGSVVVNGGLLNLTNLGQINASSITINRTGGLLLDNNGGTRSGTRILDTTAITLNSADGAFSGGTVPRGLSIRTDQNANTSETIGDLNFNSGASYVSGEGEASGTGVAVSFITANNFTRANNATFMARGRDLGAASGERNQFRIGTAGNETAFIGTLVGGAGLAGTQNISIVPWAIGAVNSGTNGAVTDNDMGNSFLTYTAGTGLRPLNLTTEYDTIALAAATDNARESLGADLTGLVGTTVNSLILNNTAFAGLDVTGTGAGQTLAVTSGAMLFTVTGGVASTAYDTTLGGFDSGITVGSSNEYVISVVNPSAAATTSTLTATIASPLSSAADITKSGRGTLVLNQVNTAGGGANKTTINEGTLQIADLDNIGGGTGGLVFAGGALRLGTGFTDDLSTRTISFLLGGGTLDTNGNDAALANSLGSGAGAFTKIGAGNLTLNATSTRTGATTLTTGTITIGANDALGVGGNLTIGAGTTLALGTNGISQGLVTTSGASPQITGTGTVTASAGFFLNHTGNTAIGAVLAGAGGLLKAQTNTVTLSGLNTYTGTTEIQAGILSFNTIGNVGGGASALGAPTSVENGIIRTGLGATSATLTYTGAGSTSDRIIEMQGTTGGLTINADGTGALALGRVQTVVNGAKTLTLQGTSAGSLANSIAGIVEVGSALSVTKAGANTWVINGANTYTGTTTAGAGTLRAGSSGAFGTSAVTLINTGSILELANGVNVGNALTVSNTGDNKVFGLQDTATSGEYSGTITIQETTAGNFDVSAGTGGTLTLSGVISGAVAGGVSKVGLGTVVLAGTAANTYTGVTGVTNGELQLNKTAGVNAIAGAINVSGGTLRWLANNQVADTASITQSAGAVNLNGRTETLTSYTKTGGTFRTGIGGKLTLTGTTFTFNGTGDNIIDAEASIEDAHLVVTNGATVQVFGANNSSYDPGPYGTSGGTLQLNAAGAGLEFTAGTNAINLDSDTSTTNVGKLLLKGNVSTSGTGAATIASVGAGAVSGLVDLDAGTRTFTIGGTNPLTVNAPITNGGLTKAGAGAMTLANAAGNTYDLGTTVSAGTLLVNNATGSGTGTGSVTVNTGATLGGSGIIAPTVNNASVSVQGLLNVGNAGDTTGADLVIDMSGATGTLVVDLTGGVTLDYFSGQGSGVLNTGLSFNDQLGIVGGGATLNLGGDLTFNNFNGLATNTFTAGSSWKLFAWSGVTTTGSFSNITGTIGNFSGFTDLSTELLGWDFSRLYDFGEVSIVVIPEPSRAMLLLLGLLGLGFRRRRTGFLS